MRIHMALFLAGSFFIAHLSSARANERDAKQLIEKAIQAHGGADRLKRIQHSVRTSKATVMVGAEKLSLTDEWIQDLPKRYRHQIEVGAQKSQQLYIVNDDQGWQVLGGVSSEMSRERLKEIQDEMYVRYLTSLTPLLTESRFTLSTIPEAVVEGNKAAGVQVSCKGQDDVKFYFDKKTGLLVKVARQARYRGFLVDKEYLYSDHKDFDGVKLPIKEQELLNGRKIVDVFSISYTFPARIDPKKFAKP